MSQQEPNGDKPYEASQKKLDDARKKGEIPRSGDLNTAAAYGGFFLVAVWGGAAALQRFGAVFENTLARAPEISADLFSGGHSAAMGGLAGAAVLRAAPFFLVPAFAVVLSILAQRSIVFVPSKLLPKMNRISLIANAKNKFGRKGLFEFIKSFAKLVVFSVVLGTFLFGRVSEIVGSALYPAKTVSGFMVETASAFLAPIFVVALSISAVDVFWQRAEHLRSNRMSKKELMDEAKQMEGDPQTKQQRRQRGQEIALNQMLADVPTADVVIVNPTHYAVALKWSRLPGAAPVCIAKGRDEVAARIREVAAKNAVPIHSDPPTARSLFSMVEVGQEIWPEHFAAVATAIRFAEALGRRERNWRDTK